MSSKKHKWIKIMVFTFENTNH